MGVSPNESQLLTPNTDPVMSTTEEISEQLLDILIPDENEQNINFNVEEFNVEDSYSAEMFSEVHIESEQDFNEISNQEKEHSEESNKENSLEEKTKLSRKRQRNPSKWKRNQNKSL